jgi:hypothetical protein
MHQRLRPTLVRQGQAFHQANAGIADGVLQRWETVEFSGPRLSLTVVSHLPTSS